MYREILEKMKALAANNNTMGASIYDLGQVMQADSMAGLTSTLKKVEDKANQKAQEERAHQEKMQQAQAQQAQQEKAMELDHETKEAEKDRRKELLVAEIRASGYGAMQDINENKQSDFVDNLEKLKKTEQYDETINLQRDKASDNKEIAREKMNLKKEEMNLQRELKATDLEIARENKNKYDVSSKKTKEKDKNQQYE